MQPREEAVPRVVYDAVKAQRDHWKEMYDLAQKKEASRKPSPRCLRCGAGPEWIAVKENAP
jgi:hypothetical protein